MNSLKIIVAAVIIVIFAAICQSEERPVNKSIAVMEPGVGIGNIKLGDNLSDVIRKMGKKPSDGKTIRSGRLTEYWLNYTDVGITFIFDSDRKLKRIAVSNPGIVTEQKGIRASSSVRDLERLYGRGETKNINDRYEQRTYKDKGISFTVSKDSGKIEAITIEPIRR
jgi:hypothetical protein